MFSFIITADKWCVISEHSPIREAQHIPLSKWTIPLHYSSTWRLIMLMMDLSWSGDELRLVMVGYETSDGWKGGNWLGGQNAWMTRHDGYPLLFSSCHTLFFSYVYWLSLLTECSKELNLWRNLVWLPWRCIKAIWHLSSSLTFCFSSSFFTSRFTLLFFPFYFFLYFSFLFCISWYKTPDKA